MLTAEQLHGLALARYEFCLQAEEDTLLPPFLGTTLRGAFGHALKAIACAMPHQDCRRCLLAPRCRYPNLFETPAGPHHALLARAQDAPRPFLFAPPVPLVSQPAAPDEWLHAREQVRAGEEVSFGLTLLGEAVADAPYFIYAVSLMAQHGLGAARAAFRLREVMALETNGSSRVIYTPDADFVQVPAPASLGSWVASRLAQMSVTDKLRVRFITPLRLRVRGCLVEQLDFAQLVKALSLRVALVHATHGTEPLAYDYQKLLTRAREVVTASANLHVQRLQRRANRQDATLNLDGLLGEITFAGAEMGEFLPLLAAGELLHLGSSTAFGLGRLALTGA